jgi:uncharacterized protein DUF4186
MDLAIAQHLQALAKSKFRSKFTLPPKELAYLHDKGFETIEQHARDFVRQRLVLANPENDGKQTPMKNHPVFIASSRLFQVVEAEIDAFHEVQPFGFGTYSSSSGAKKDRISFIPSLGIGRTVFPVPDIKIPWILSRPRP